MKKLLIILLIFILAFGLCACGEDTDAFEDTTWVASEDGAEIRSFRLLASGKALVHPIKYGDNEAITDLSTACFGEWQVDNGKIIIFDDDGEAYIFNIVDENTLSRENDTYLKAG